MWKREDLMNLSEQERLEKTKSMIHIDDLDPEMISKIRLLGLEGCIGWVNGVADIHLYPEEYKMLMEMEKPSK